MAGLDTKLETLLEIIELLVCKGDITNCNPERKRGLKSGSSSVEKKTDIQCRMNG